MKCFYHIKDIDGICSGAIVRRRYPDCKMIGFDYGDLFPFESINPKELIVLVDISLSPKDMLKFVTDKIKVIWVDHHQSAILDAESYGYSDLRGLRRVGVGACELTWQYFFETSVPQSVVMLSKYDVWNHTDPLIIPFQYGIASLGLTVYNNNWNSVFEDLIIDRTVYTGQRILRYVKHSTRSIFRETMYRGTWEGYTNVFMNSCIIDSVLYTLLPQADLFSCDMIISYYRKPDGRFKVSLRAYKPEVDVSVVAAKYGGGGHKGAAGFVCKTLPFN